MADQFDLETNALIGRIAISTGGAKRKEAEGVLNVRVTGRDPVEDERLLEALSNTYFRRRCSNVSVACPTAWTSSTSKHQRSKPILISSGRTGDFRTVIRCWNPPRRGSAEGTRNRHGCQVLGWKPNATG